MTVTLQVADVGIDYSYARPNLKVAARCGAKFVIRYTAGSASLPDNPSYSLNAGKLITPAEFQAILAAGMDVIANDEWYTNRITEGYAAGLADGRAAASVWKSCGLSRGATIYVSWDENPSPAKYLSVLRYVRGYRKGLAGYYDVDVYAGTGFLKWAFAHGLVKFGWRPNAGSWSNDGLPYQPDTSSGVRRTFLAAQAAEKTPAHIWQTGNYWFDKSADEDMILRLPVGSHLEALAAQQHVPPTPDRPPAVNPIDGKEMTLTPEEKAYIDGKFADLENAVRGAFSDSQGRPHKLMTWLSAAVGKKVDIK